MNKKIKNFVIIAHIDHGKSTLADRMLEFTKTVSKREMKAQLLDQMDIERERGITIKLQPVRMSYANSDGEELILNLIDTPGHVDFTYEVSRSLAAVEGAILLVDATQGIQAQTLANLYLAMEQDLTIIPVINKIDLPNADVEKVKNEIVKLIGVDKDDVLLVSAKTGQGVSEVLARVADVVPEASQVKDRPYRALIFDTVYDSYRGVIAYVRLVDGTITAKSKAHFLATKMDTEIIEVGTFSPNLKAKQSLEAGEIGYIVTGLKDISASRVGDTIAATVEEKPLAGYQQVMPMVFAGIYSKEGDEYEKLRDAINKLKLNDAALIFEPEQSQALGFGFRVGLLGLLHLEILQERLRREYNLDLVVTTPSVAYQVTLTNGDEIVVRSPQELPDPTHLKEAKEPWVSVTILTPKSYVGGIMQLVQGKRGIYKNTEYIDDQRVILNYEMPLAPILVDFYDSLKGISAGYASMNYDLIDNRKTDIVKMDILVADEPIEALSTIVFRPEAYDVGKIIVKALKDTLSRENFVIKIQAAIGGKIIAAERLSAMRKDVTAGLYGGDVTRKRKLLEKQKKGKKRMKDMGKVDIPPEAFLAVLKR